jgi:hypothetical protein
MGIVKFKHPDKKPTDPLVPCDPVPEYLNAEARSIYLRIINESKKGVLLQADQIATALAAQTTARALSENDGAQFIGNIDEIFAELLLPELGREYINQVLNR